jgi:hypothetical protein
MESPFMDLNRLPSRPDYIILTKEFSQRYLPESGGTKIFEWHYLEQQGYRIAYRHKTPLDWLPLSNREVQEQINVINPEVLILKKRDASSLRPSVHLNLAGFFNKEKVTIAVTDSGLGGLAVMAEAVRRMKDERVFKEADFIFYNALFSLEGGYNSLKTRQEKIEVFSSALENLERKYQPDLILIGCNTLSVLYPDTPFSRKTKIPVIGIVEAGVEMIAEGLRAHPEAAVILFGTPTTVSEATHKRLRRGGDRDAHLRLRGRGPPENRFSPAPFLRQPQLHPLRLFSSPVGEGVRGGRGKAPGHPQPEFQDD